MKYFVHSVQTYAVAGTTRKGAILQEVARRFEGAIVDTEVLERITASFRYIVAVVNRRYKGKPLAVHAGGGWICVKPEFNGNDNHVFSISYKPIVRTIDADAVPELFRGFQLTILQDTAAGAEEGGAV